MASPQKENGFTPIANELLDKIGGLKLLGSEFQVVFCVLRKTYGWNKKEDWISLSQFEEFTHLSRPTVVSVLKNLIENQIINKSNNKFSVNKDWEKWGGKAGLTSKAGLTRTSKHRLTITSKAGLTHKRQLNTIKDTPAKAVVNKSMKTFNYDTGEYQEEPKKGHKRSDVIELASLFDSMATKLVGKTIRTPKSYFIVLGSMNTHKMKPAGIKMLFEDWFADGKVKDADKVKLSWALSANNINSWKTKN